MKNWMLSCLVDSNNLEEGNEFAGHNFFCSLSYVEISDPVFLYFCNALVMKTISSMLFTNFWSWIISFDSLLSATRKSVDSLLLLDFHCMYLYLE